MPQVSYEHRPAHIFVQRGQERTDKEFDQAVVTLYARSSQRQASSAFLRQARISAIWNGATSL
jgi:hypothetical protein